MTEDDVSYFRRRAEDETYLAQHATCPQAVAAHYEMATLYFERVDAGEVAERSPARGCSQQIPTKMRLSSGA